MFREKLEKIIKITKEKNSAVRIKYGDKETDCVIIHKKTNYSILEDCVMVSISDDDAVWELVPLHAIRTVQFTTKSMDEIMNDVMRERVPPFLREMMEDDS